MNQIQSKLRYSVYDVAISGLLALNHETRSSHFESNFKEMGREKFFQECQTIHVNAGRQTGKNSWIVRNAESDWLIVVLDDTTKKSLEVKLSEHRININLPKIVTVKEIKSNLFNQNFLKIFDCQMIVFNEASIAFETFNPEYSLKRKDFYAWLDKSLSTDNWAGSEDIILLG